ncbi:hypothetical protein, partial [Listeria monocytogenes]|uniref:hypothetical protein n=1 Tax=Listeria monocytogenes TaxID=1639 RepID=UPI001A908EBC
WGLWKRPDGHGGLDNPYFVQKMHEFIYNPDNRVQFAIYFDRPNGSSGGDHALFPFDTNKPTLFPKASAEFLRLFGK